MQLMQTAAIIVLAAVISACASPNMGHAPSNFAPAAKDETAYLIGTMGVQTEGDDRSPNGGYELKFRAAGTQTGGRWTDTSGTIRFLQVDFHHTPVAYRTLDSKGGVFVIALKPGNYEFHNVHFHYNVFLGHRYISARQDFSIPFTVKPGRALYVGELTARTAWDRSSNPLNHIAAAGFFTRSNKFERDQALLETAHPEIKGIPVDILAPEIQAPPFVRSPIKYL
jgi:hypothetical protein